MSAITELDFSILDALQKIHNPVLDVILAIFTAMGEYGAFWVILTIVMLCIKKTRDVGKTSFVVLFMEFFISEKFLKHLIARDRPFVVRDWVELSPYILKPHGYSCPSGHTCTSFSVATVIFLYNKKLGIAAYAVACVIGFSRNYFYVHFPSDVLLGALEGILLGIIAYFITKKIREKRAEKALTSSEDQ